MAEFMNAAEVIFLSVRPRFAEAILAHTKTAELRRTRPRVSRGTRVLIYSSSPVCAAMGVAVVRGLVEETPPKLWRSIAKKCGVRRSEFDAYFENADRAFAILLRSIQRLEAPISL